DVASAPLDFVPNTARELDMDVVVSNNYAFGGNNASLVLRTPGPQRDFDELPEPDVVVTGLGPVLSLGIGVDELSTALGERRRVHGGEPSLEGRTFAPRSVWRHMNRLSRMAIAASRLAWDDAGLKLGRAGLENVGVVFATAAGSVESTFGFDESVLANPTKPAVLSFSNVVLNATGGAVCQTLGLRGVTTTICNGNASASIALDCAVEAMRCGKADVVLVVAADEAPDGPGAVCLVVESAEHSASRGNVPYARVRGSAHASVIGEHERGLVERGIGAVGAHAADLVVASGAHLGDPAEQEAVAAALPAAPVTGSAALTGDLRSVTGALDLAVGALAIRDGVAPATAPAGGDPTVASALVLGSAPGSVRGATLLEAV
ncbi:3-oxoacyl-ACP synthase, partial [Streptomyces regensis]